MNPYNRRLHRSPNRRRYLNSRGAPETYEEPFYRMYNYNAPESTRDYSSITRFEHMLPVPEYRNEQSFTNSYRILANRLSDFLDISDIRDTERWGEENFSIEDPNVRDIVSNFNVAVHRWKMRHAYYSINFVREIEERDLDVLATVYLLSELPAFRDLVRNHMRRSNLTNLLDRIEERERNLSRRL